MPMRMTYDFECVDCGTAGVKKFTLSEYLVREDEVVICPQCGGIMQRKITGNGGVVFKGDGWPDKHTETGDE